MINDIQEKTYEELARIRSLLEILASDKIREKLESVATTKERQMIWASCDGTTSTEEIARKTGISQRAVQLFVKDLVEKDLLDIGKRGYPKRRFEIIPSSWRANQDVRTIE
jgi:predicted ArsR family transcriptional regulator